MMLEYDFHGLAVQGVPGESVVSGGVYNIPQIPGLP